MRHLQGLFWLENKITENQWKIVKNIYTLFQMVHFWPVPTVSSNFRQFFPKENSWNQLNNWQKSSLHLCVSVIFEEIQDFEALKL